MARLIAHREAARSRRLGDRASRRPVHVVFEKDGSAKRGRATTRPWPKGRDRGGSVASTGWPGARPGACGAPTRQRPSSDEDLMSFFRGIVTETERKQAATQDVPKVEAKAFGCPVGADGGSGYWLRLVGGPGGPLGRGIAGGVVVTLRDPERNADSAGVDGCNATVRGVDGPRQGRWSPRDGERPDHGSRGGRAPGEAQVLGGVEKGVGGSPSTRGIRGSVSGRKRRRRRRLRGSNPSPSWERRRAGTGTGNMAGPAFQGPWARRVRRPWARAEETRKARQDKKAAKKQGSNPQYVKGEGHLEDRRRGDNPSTPSRQRLIDLSPLGGGGGIDLV